MSKFHRRFSIGHHDDNSENCNHAQSLLNAQKKFQDEISDVYFGGAFQFHYNGLSKVYGNVMGRLASNTQVKSLLDVQEETGIQASMTLNEMTFFPEIVADKDIRNQFIAYLKSFYDAGIRMCTISDTHLMGAGFLQEIFPDMHWKNTVNHIVKNAQEVVDYAALGYNTILIDRSLNRDVEELKNTYKVAQKLGVKTSLLTKESCMPACPFKREHEQIQPYMENGYKPIEKLGSTYWGQLGGISCNRWRSSNIPRKDDKPAPIEPMPRIGTDIVALDRETLDVYLDNTDIFKHSGRLINQVEAGSACWIDASDKAKWRREEADIGTELIVGSFSEIYERNLWPFHSWKLFVMERGDTGSEDYYKERRDNSVWGSKKAKALNKTLMTCKNQCYDCHACERVFGFQDFDTLLEIKDTQEWREKADALITDAAVLIDVKPV